MDTLRDWFDKVASGHIPTGILAGAAVVMFLLALKAAKGFFKLVFVLLALAALAGAVWWHFHKH